MSEMRELSAEDLGGPAHPIMLLEGSQYGIMAMVGIGDDGVHTHHAPAVSVTGKPLRDGDHRMPEPQTVVLVLEPGGALQLARQLFEVVLDQEGLDAVGEVYNRQIDRMVATESPSSAARRIMAES